MAYGHIASIGKINVSYGTADNETVLLTIDNILCFTSTISGVTRNDGLMFATLPAEIPNPSRFMMFPAVYYDTEYRLGIFYLNTNGNIGTEQNLSNATVYLNGISLNMNNDYYNDTIGNNDMSAMTTPMTAR